MKKEIPWELIISDLKQDISDADKKHLEEWVSIDENRRCMKNFGEFGKRCVLKLSIIRRT